MRLFVGIPLADAVARELAGVAARLRSDQSGTVRRLDGLRWTEPQSWHITLQFLGNATAAQLECLTGRLADLRGPPPIVELGELGRFDRAGVLFAEVIVTAELARLQEKVVAATGACGFVAGTRPFHPHITLARKTADGGTRGSKRSGEQGSGAAREPRDTLRELTARAGRQRAFTGFMAPEFVLYESHLGREGAKYEIRGRFPLVDS